MTRLTTPKRTEIADAALSIIGSRGITELTMANLAAELGVTPGAPFRHFKSRDEILEEVTYRVVELVGATFPDPGLPPLERLSQLFLARTETMGRHAGLARLIFSDQFTKALPEQAATKLHSLVKRTRTCLLEALEEAAARGEIRRDLPPEALLVPVMGTLQHLSFLTALPTRSSTVKRPSPRQALDTLKTLLQSGPTSK